LEEKITIAKSLLELRLKMMVINQEYKEKKFKIPIHLAFGHEAIAVAVNLNMHADDQLVCSHRNLHYNLAREKSFRRIMDEFFLRKEGVAGGRLGSMNLSNPYRNLVYSSSILGNNIPVATGLALANSVKGIDSITTVISGDGAMEEGSLYEGLLFMRYQNLKVIVIIEDNGWSLATRTNERRTEINTRLLAESLGVGYTCLAGNDSFEYTAKLADVTDHIRNNAGPVVVEVKLDTLGNWILKNDQNPDGKYINYHAGPAPNISVSNYPIISRSESDPVYILEKILGREDLKKISSSVFTAVTDEFGALY
jgi:TPP-dependent pyruvate/acetoin dehydrogenase alpha subunit